MKTLYFDMDNVLVDFQSGVDKLPEKDKTEYYGRYDEHPYIFSMMEPMEDALGAFYALNEYFDCYILSTAPWDNPNAWLQKRKWVEKHLGKLAHKRLILSHHKNLNSGDYLIDDRTKNGAGEFKGEHIHFGQEGFTTWFEVLDYLFEKEGLV